MASETLDPLVENAVANHYNAVDQKARLSGAAA